MGRGFAFRVFEVQGLAFVVRGFKYGFLGSGFGVFNFRGCGSMFRDSGFCIGVSRLGFGFASLGFRVGGSVLPVWGFAFRVQCFRGSGS